MAGLCKPAVQIRLLLLEPPAVNPQCFHVAPGYPVLRIVGLLALTQKQLDLLFADEVMDIATDIKVIEGMLAKDGLVGPFNEKKTP